MRVAVAGSSGLIGRALLEALGEAGEEVVRLVRRQRDAPSVGRAEISWDPSRRTVRSAELEGIDAFVNLSGAGIGDHRWSGPRKKEIVDSRVNSTTFLSETIASLSERPRVLVNASAVGYYGDRGDELLTEQSPAGGDFLAELCRRWEASTEPARSAGVRVVHLRSGVVLAGTGGALARQLPLFRAGLGGRLGRGRQWLSWITLADEVRAVQHVLRDESLEGAVNSTSPAPVTNSVFTKALARALHRPAVFFVPPLLLRLVLGRQLAEGLALASQRALPVRLEASGFRFDHPEIGEALEAVLSRTGDLRS